MGFWISLVYLSFLILSPVAVMPTLHVYRVQWIVGALGALLTAATLPIYGYPIRNLQVVLMTLFVMQISLSRLVGGWIGGAVYAVVEFGGTAIVFYMLVAAPPTIRRLRLLAIVFSLPAFYAVFRGILAVFFGIDRQTYIFFQNLFATGEVIIGVVERIRFLGFLSDPNDLSQYFLMVVPFVALIGRRGAMVRNVAIVVPLLAYLFFGMYLTHSRGVLVGLLVLTMMYFRERFNKTVMTIGSVALGVLLVAANFAGGRAISFGSGSDRIEAWGVGLSLLRGNPLFGVGYNLFTEHNELTAHNSFVLSFAELGLIGCFIWVAMLVSTMLGLTQFLRKFRPVPAAAHLVRWATAVRMSLVGFIVTSWFLSRTYSGLLFVVIAMWVMLDRMGRQIAVPAPAPLPAASRPARVPKRPWHWAPATATVEVAGLLLIYLMVRIRWLN